MICYSHPCSNQDHTTVIKLHIYNICVKIPKLHHACVYLYVPKYTLDLWTTGPVSCACMVIQMYFCPYSVIAKHAGVYFKLELIVSHWQLHKDNNRCAKSHIPLWLLT